MTWHKSKKGEIYIYRKVGSNWQPWNSKQGRDIRISCLPSAVKLTNFYYFYLYFFWTILEFWLAAPWYRPVEGEHFLSARWACGFSYWVTLTHKKCSLARDKFSCVKLYFFTEEKKNENSVQLDNDLPSHKLLNHLKKTVWSLVHHCLVVAECTRNSHPPTLVTV